MKLIFSSVIVFAAVFLFFEYDEYERYSKNIQIEKAPVYVTAQFDNVTHIESRKHNNVSYFLKYKFQSPKGEFRGSTGALDRQQLLKYVSSGSIDIVYYADDPKFNAVKNYFRPGVTKKEFSQSFVVSSVLGLMAAIPFALLLSLIGWSKRKIESSSRR